MITPEQSRQAVGRVVSRLQDEEFFGKLTITFQRGNVTVLALSQTLLPDVVVHGSREFVALRTPETTDEQA